LRGVGIHGHGTKVRVETRRKDGSIRRRVRVAVTMADGRRVWRTLPNDREADRELARLTLARELDLDPTRQTLADYLRSWIGSQRDAKRRRIRERTLIGYERIVERVILPELGRIPLSRLSRRKVQAWIDGLDGSAQTVRNAHAVLRKALAGAAGDLIPLNPALGVELPERREFRGNPLTADEARRLLEATQDTRLGVLWRLAIVTGLREGELLGLPRDAMEMEERDGEARTRLKRAVPADRLDGAGEASAGMAQPRVAGRDGSARSHGTALIVKHQLQRINGEWVLGPTKAGRSVERIELDQKTVEMVRAHLARMAEERDPSWRYFGLMFLTESGQPYHNKALLRAFGEACDAAGIARRRFHDLRGTSATILRDLGVAEDTRRARLGHSTTEMARHYAKASVRQDREAVELLAEAIS
jgi:integrase